MRKLLLLVILFTACSSILTVTDVEKAFKTAPNVQTNGATITFDKCSVDVYPTTDEAKLRHQTLIDVAKDLGRKDSSLVHKNVMLYCELSEEQTEPYKKALESL